MKILFLGGTGIISTASARLAIERGMDVYVLNRGNRPDTLLGATTIVADINDHAAATEALRDYQWDAVVDWIAFTPDDIERDLRLFAGRTAQYVFISSASAYQRPVGSYRITEDTPLVNPFWEYSRRKIACEDRLVRAGREDGFPYTIVRPSLTYGDTQIPLVLNNWQRPWTMIDRMRRGKPVIVPGDGTSLWTITHNTDFAKGLVGLLGHAQALGHTFHITSDEVMTWDQFYQVAAQAAGTEARIVHIASDFLTACVPDLKGTLTGDKATSVVFDNSKIKRFVPDFTTTTMWAQGVRRTLAWFEADPSRQVVDDATNLRLDRLIAAYEQGQQEAVRQFLLH